MSKRTVLFARRLRQNPKAPFPSERVFGKGRTTVIQRDQAGAPVPDSDGGFKRLPGLANRKVPCTEPMDPVKVARVREAIKRG